MSVAWTTVVIIALLLPGVFVFIGLSFYERFSREIIKTNAAGEVGWAIFVALVLHLSAWWLLSRWFAFDLEGFLLPVFAYDRVAPHVLVAITVQRLAPVLIYTIAMAVAGLLLGWMLAWLMIRGTLRFLATHKWIYEVMRSARRGLVTAYVMTSTVESGRVLMYKGTLHELYLSPEGKLAYIVLKNCSRYYMIFGEDSLRPTQQYSLFSEPSARPKQLWDYLMIEGSMIANVLFTPSRDIRTTPKGTAALEQAYREALVRQSRLNAFHDLRRSAEIERHGAASGASD